MHFRKDGDDGFFLQIRTGDTGGAGFGIDWTAFSPFPEWRHADYALFSSKFSCLRNSPNGEIRGFSQEKNSGVELKERIQRTEKLAALPGIATVNRPVELLLYRKWTPLISNSNKEVGPELDELLRP